MNSRRKPTEKYSIEEISSGKMVTWLNEEAYAWLGPRYKWYDKVRKGEHGSMEEHMLATRSALVGVKKALNSALIKAYNEEIEAVRASGQAPQDWPDSLEAGEGDSAPHLDDSQDARLISWMPLKFLNTAQIVRLKGKGLDFYADGLVKKMLFKVIGFYSDPRRWEAKKLGYFLHDLPVRATFAEIQRRLNPLSVEIKALTESYQLFRFSSSPHAIGSGTGESLPVTRKALIKDLYLQSFLYRGMEQFIFRYFLTLLSQARHPIALRQLSAQFRPLLARIEEISQQFQLSLLFDPDKRALRKEFQETFKHLENGETFALSTGVPGGGTPPEGSPAEFRPAFTHRILRSRGFVIAERLNDSQWKPWREFLKAHVLKEPDPQRQTSLLVAVLNSLVLHRRNTFAGMLEASRKLASHADTLDKREKIKLEHVKKRFAAETNKKKERLIALRARKQHQAAALMAKDLETHKVRQQRLLKGLEQATTRRRTMALDNARKLARQSETGLQGQLGGEAGAVMGRLLAEGNAHELRQRLVPELIRYLHDFKDDTFRPFFCNVFQAVPGLYPTEKMVLRGEISSLYELEDAELNLSEEEREAFERQVENRREELEHGFPGLLDLKLMEGPLMMSLERLLILGLTQGSLELVLNLEFGIPGKRKQRIPKAAWARILMLNHLLHPVAKIDVMLPNADQADAPAKRINFNSLRKMAG